MILLDTNVVSQAMNPLGDVSVVRWMDGQPDGQLHIPVIVLHELWYGIANLPPGNRRSHFETAYAGLRSRRFARYIVPFTEAAAEKAAEFRILRQRRGNPVDVGDAMIAGTAAAHGCAVATRNIADFDGLGLTLINPFEAPQP